MRGGGIFTRIFASISVNRLRAVNVLNPREKTDFPAITSEELNELCAGSFTADIAEYLITDIR